jgi:hypothetical protein
VGISSEWLAKGGCLFFFRAGWRVSSKSLSRGRGPVLIWLPFVLLFTLTFLPFDIYINGVLMFLYLLPAELGWRVGGLLREGREGISAGSSYLNRTELICLWVVDEFLEPLGNKARKGLKKTRSQ